jgi:anti-sigma factor RsiW
VWLLSRDLVCQEAIELVTDYLEGGLSRRQRRRFESHLRTCPNCSGYLRQIRIIIATTGRVEPEQLEPEVRDSLVELFRRFQGER